ncbi:Uncharacterised protein [Chryseobacterium carnipullorum]|uniref:Uncharacterized protein n=2 Tax=Chryseobacterium carnipullorum TaxID=1124835 RepID=A0A376DY82_CHRCU|nr:Uncharacterised protein [Chryseobacterium carnipullorum]
MIGMLMITGITFAQTDRLWSHASQRKTDEVQDNKTDLNNPKIFSLDLTGLKNALSAAPKRLIAGQKSEIIISFPNSEGKMENFKVTENPNFEPELAAKYPDIKSYMGQGLEDSGSTIYFSVSH